MSNESDNTRGDVGSAAEERVAPTHVEMHMLTKKDLATVHGISMILNIDIASVMLDFQDSNIPRVKTAVLINADYMDCFKSPQGLG